MKKIVFDEALEAVLPLEKRPLPELSAQDFPSGAELSTPFEVYILKECWSDIQNHVRKNQNLETGGILVGYAFRDINHPEYSFTIITGAIRQDTPHRGLAHFTVTPKDIAQARQALEKDYEGLWVTGWYHSHPGHGVFLSGQDMQIVRSIYNSPWQVALVIDPIRSETAFFRGAEGERLNGWQKLEQKPESIFAICHYNQALEALQRGDKEPLEAFKAWLRESKSEQMAHWQKLGKYQDLILDLTSDLEFEQKYQDACSHERAGALNTALSLYREIEKIDPDYKDVLARIQSLKNAVNGKRHPLPIPEPHEVSNQTSGNNDEQS